MYDTLLNLVTQTSKSFFYFGVGSCPHVRTVEELTPRWDQLLPCFVRDISQNKNEKIQILHIDPHFTNSLTFLKEYFSLNLPDSIFYEMNNIYIWETSRLQVICASCRFDHPSTHNEDNHEWFLDALTEEALVHSFRMVYQEYTGAEMKSLFRKFFETCDENLKRRFRSLVLFDVSYGNDTGCSTDLTKYKPIYESNGMFLNLQVLTYEELLEKVDVHPSVRDILKRNLLADFRRILNEIHVDYRRKMNGDPVFHPSIYGYDDSSSATVIMHILERHIFNLVPLLQKLGMLSQDATQSIKHLFAIYASMDRYKWYQEMFNLVKFEPPAVPPLVQ